jgi:uncharacterized protein
VIIPLLRGIPGLEYGRFMPQKTIAATKLKLESIYQVWAWILLAWSVYRYFLKFPEWTDELFFKPIIFIIPVLVYVFRKEKRDLESIGITTKHIFTGIYTGVGFGFLFAMEGLLVNWLRNGRIVINPIAAFAEYGMAQMLILSLATALWEELLSRGFLFHRIYEYSKNIVFSTLISTLLFVLLHVPILVTSLKLQGGLLGLFFFTNFILGCINSLLFLRTKSLAAPVLVHLFWNMTVALYL